jgi:hypothetical protein
MLLMVRLAVPVLVRVTVCGGLVVPRSCVPKVRLVGDRVTAGLPANALPLHSGMRLKAIHKPVWARERASRRSNLRWTQDHSPRADGKNLLLTNRGWGGLGGGRTELSHETELSSTSIDAYTYLV